MTHSGVETTGNAESVKSRTEFLAGAEVQQKVCRSGEPTLMPQGLSRQEDLRFLLSRFLYVSMWLLQVAGCREATQLDFAASAGLTFLLSLRAALIRIGEFGAWDGLGCLGWFGVAA